jgi:hypothetical protein
MCILLHLCVLCAGVSLLLCGACGAAVVYTSSYAGVVALTFAQGFSGGSIDAPANVAIVRIHGDVSQQAINTPL